MPRRTAREESGADLGGRRRPRREEKAGREEDGAAAGREEDGAGGWLGGGPVSGQRLAGGGPVSGAPGGDLESGRKTRGGTWEWDCGSREATGSLGRGKWEPDGRS